MDDEFIEIYPKEAIFFDEYPMAKIFAEFSVKNKIKEKVVFRVDFFFLFHHLLAL